MSVRSALLLFLLLPACKKDQPKTEDLLSPLDSKLSAVVVGTGVGSLSEVHVPVYGVNGYGAMINTASISLSSDTALDATSITPSADGWGEAVMRPGAAGAYSVTAATAAGTSEGWGYAVDSTPGQVEFPAMISHGEADFMANAGNGIAWAVGGDVWWGVPGSASPPIPVLSLEEPVTGMFAVEVDQDGNTDLMVRTGSMVILLKGLDQGGLAWGTGYSSKSPIVGSTVTDVDGDGISDLLVDVSDASSTSVAWMIGDGLWGFEQTSVLSADYPSLAVSAEDYNGDKVAEVTLLTADGLLRRYALYDGDWLAATTIDYELNLGPGSQLAPSVDVNGDRSPDIIAWGPTLDGAGYQAWVVTAGSTQPTRYRLFDDTNLPAYVSLTTGYLTDDGIVDVALVTDASLVRVLWKPKQPMVTPTIYVTSDIVTGKSLAIGKFAGDDLPDVVVGSDEVVVLPGAVTADDPDTTDKDESVPWRVQTPVAQAFDLSLTGLPWIGDFNGDGIVDLVGGIQADTSVGLRAYVGHPEENGGNESLVAGPLVPLASSATVLGVSVCGQTVHFLLDEGVPTLYTYSVASTGVLTEALSPIQIPGGALMACGAFPGGDVAVADPAGKVTYVDASGNVNQGESSTGATAVAARDADGDGVYTLEQCSEADCQIAVADLDGVPGDDVAELYGGTLTVEAGGQSYTVPDAGKGLWAGDVDGDGKADLVVGDGSYWRTYRVVAGGIVPEDAHYIWRPAGDHPMFGDLDGNGVPDLLVPAVDDANSGDATDWTGQLLYSEAADR